MRPGESGARRPRCARLLDVLRGLPARGARKPAGRATVHPAAVGLTAADYDPAAPQRRSMARFGATRPTARSNSTRHGRWRAERANRRRHQHDSHCAARRRADGEARVLAAGGVLFYGPCQEGVAANRNHNEALASLRARSGMGRARLGVTVATVRVRTHQRVAMPANNQRRSGGGRRPERTGRRPDRSAPDAGVSFGLLDGGVVWLDVGEARSPGTRPARERRRRWATATPSGPHPGELNTALLRLAFSCAAAVERSSPCRPPSVLAVGDGGACRRPWPHPV